MAAAVSAASTWRLLPGPAGSSGKLALVGVSPPDAVGLGTGAGACAAGPIKATGFTETDGEVIPQQAHCSQARSGGLPSRPQMPLAPKGLVPPSPSSRHSSAAQRNAQAVRWDHYTL